MRIAGVLLAAFCALRGCQRLQNRSRRAHLMGWASHGSSRSIRAGVPGLVPRWAIANCWYLVKWY